MKKFKVKVVFRQNGVRSNLPYNHYEIRYSNSYGVFWSTIYELATNVLRAHRSPIGILCNQWYSVSFSSYEKAEKEILENFNTIDKIRLYNKNQERFAQIARDEYVAREKEKNKKVSYMKSEAKRII